MKQAMYFQKFADGRVKCVLCPHSCIIDEGKYGQCRIRKNYNGSLIAEAYAQISAAHIDPIEKKPLYHYFPGSSVFSIGFNGCNLHCRFCQNWSISQSAIHHNNISTEAGKVVQNALRAHCSSIAYTYNEALTNFEYVLETAAIAHQSGLKNIVVSNGYINHEPLNEILPLIDAFNIDLKAFSDSFYKANTGGSLQAVLDTLKLIRLSGKHHEITFLLIPELNDDESLFIKMLEYIKRELGADTILHISAYHPAYKTKIDATSAAMVLRFANIARNYLFWVYAGNVSLSAYQDSVCPKCGTLLISRNGYNTIIGQIDKNGCGKCGESLPFILNEII